MLVWDRISHYEGEMVCRDVNVFARLAKNRIILLSSSHRSSSNPRALGLVFISMSSPKFKADAEFVILLESCALLLLFWHCD